MGLKQAILVRTDLKLPKGKLAVQVAHASCEAALHSDKKKLQLWMRGGQKKIVLKVKDLDELRLYKKQAEDAKLRTALICDAGLTVLPPGTVTCLAIGPDFDDRIDRITGKLKML